MYVIEICTPLHSTELILFSPITMFDIRDSHDIFVYSN